MILKLTENISCVPATEEPLSADVVMIRGAKEAWIYDVGAGNEALAALQQITEPKNIVLSHFHPDHVANLSKVAYRNLYVSSNTFRYTGTGTIITGTMTVEDGPVGIRVFPIPSSHAKGSLALEAGESILFIGDALYPTVKAGKTVYNRQLLRDGLQILRACKGTTVCVSHARPFTVKKRDLLAYFERVLALGPGNEPYIEVSPG